MSLFLLEKIVKGSLEVCLGLLNSDKVCTLYLRTLHLLNFVIIKVYALLKKLYAST